MLADPFRRLSLVTIFALASVGCHGRSPDGAASTAPQRVALVRVGTGTPGMLTLPARVKALEEATLTARAPGRVSAFLAREGQYVAEGTPLVRFDAPEARQSLAAARAEELAARSAQAFATRQHARIESLYTAGVVAIADREDAESRQHAAESRLAQASAAREVAESAVEVRAPFASVVVRRHVDAGADVQPGQPLLDLRSPNGSQIVAAVPEGAAGDLAHASAWVQVGDGPWRAARLVSADGMVDPATRSRTARYVPVERGGLEPGAFARLRLELPQTPGAGAEATPIAVPLASVVRRGALTGVLVVESNRAWLRWVRLGRTQGDAVEVLSGLRSGEQVVAAPAGLTDGASVASGS